MYVSKSCWISVKVSERVAKIVRTVASAVGVSARERGRYLSWLEPLSVKRAYPVSEELSTIRATVSLKLHRNP
jgi:hypothetical protein